MGDRSAAIIPAVAALAGALVGGAATYLTSEQLQNHQVQQEALREATATRAVVRLLRAEYSKDGDRLLNMVHTRKYTLYAYRERAFVSHVGADDLKLLAGDLSASDWEHISEASQAIEAVQVEVEAHRGHGRIGPEEREVFELTSSRCETAYKDLAPLAEGRRST